MDTAIGPRGTGMGSGRVTKGWLTSSGCGSKPGRNTRASGGGKASLASKVVTKFDPPAPDQN